jgi:hypothetical protein
LDVYDPAFEEDLNTFTDTSGTWAEEDFWFTTSGQTAPDAAHNSADAEPKTQLLNLIKQRELTK